MIVSKVCAAAPTGRRPPALPTMAAARRRRTRRPPYPAVGGTLRIGASSFVGEASAGTAYSSVWRNTFDDPDKRPRRRTRRMNPGSGGNGTELQVAGAEPPPCRTQSSRDLARGAPLRHPWHLPDTCGRRWHATELGHDRSAHREASPAAVTGPHLKDVLSAGALLSDGLSCAANTCG